MKNVEERTKGMTLDEVRLKYVASGLKLIANRVSAVLGSGLSAGQRDLLKEALSILERMQERM